MARPKSEDKKQALLEAATAAFAQSGIAASTSAIARSAGVAEGTLFRYFATKDELLNELYLAIKLRLVRTMIAGLDPDEKRPKENARNIWNSYIDWGVRNPMEHKAIRRTAPLATPCFCRWRKPPSNSPATIRSAPGRLSPSALKPCGTPCMRRTPNDPRDAASLRSSYRPDLPVYRALLAFWARVRRV